MDHSIITEENWGKIAKNKTVSRYTLSNGELSVSVINFGATVQRIVYRGQEMIFSLPEARLYQKFSFGCIGAVVGRYAGRIAGGRFTLDGKEYRLTRNLKGNHLHGGRHGFNTKLWESRVIGNDCVEFTLLSPDGEEGYPGNLNVSVSYHVTDDNSLTVSYEAHSDRDTVINLTNHCYFNPNGVDSTFPKKQESDEPDNRDVSLMIDADRIVELNGEIPTGRLLPVEGTVFDFRTPRKLAVMAENLPDESFSGYDHTFALNHCDPEQPIAVARGLRSNITIKIFTDQPAVQLFTMGNPGNAFALETQHFPDSPNHPEFPSTVLRAGESFRSRTVYRFSYE